MDDKDIEDYHNLIDSLTKKTYQPLPNSLYIGDSKIGKSVNIGAGTITCNYDGVKKSKTKINDNVFIGSNSSLVAPLTIEKDSVVGAGSVITKKVKKKSLALTRSLQIEVQNYKQKKK